MSNLCVNSVNSDAHCDRYELTDKKYTTFKIHKQKVKITSTTKKQRLKRVFCSTGKNTKKEKGILGKSSYRHKVTKKECKSIMNTLRSPVAVMAGDSARIASPLSRHKIPPCSLLPTVILRRFQDKRENLIKLGRKMKSLSGSRRGKEEGKRRKQKS